MSRSAASGAAARAGRPARSTPTEWGPRDSSDRPRRGVICWATPSTTRGSWPRAVPDLAAERARVLARSLLPALALLLAATAGGDACADRGHPSAERSTPETERRRMVEEQLAARGIRDRRVLEAMGKVPRERFVPEQWRSLAYLDEPLPIGRGQTISQPYVVAFMAQALALRGGERVLEVGSGSGYAAAVLAHLAGAVYGIELEPELHARSVETLAELGYGNVHLRRGDGFLGWPERAPFRAIVVSCAMEEIPAPLWEQLVQGGRIVYPKGPEGEVQLLVVVTKTARGPREEHLAPVRFVPMRRGG
ncbi:protein-L-isoaspartate O-methyltransferase [Anaeromyxobacter sp. Fw109-5]|nr:protein-L-isoaspartate O-methyltransferase [Anaeromyxobacter sp. Fw109-5]